LKDEIEKTLILKSDKEKIKSILSKPYEVGLISKTFNP
jgi:hypothetical protein